MTFTDRRVEGTQCDHLQEAIQGYCKLHLQLFMIWDSYQHKSQRKLNITFGRSRIWLASSNSSSKLREYLKMSSGTVGSEQWRLSTYSTCRLQPLNIGIQRNMTSHERITLHIIINCTHSTNTTFKNFSEMTNISITVQHPFQVWTRKLLYAWKWRHHIGIHNRHPSCWLVYLYLPINCRH